jgi:hypothetical protein
VSIRYFLISISLHLALLVGIGRYLFITPRHTPPPQYVEILGSDSAPVVARRKGVAGGKSAAQAPLKKPLSLSDLGVDWRRREGVTLPGDVSLKPGTGKNDDYGGQGRYGSNGDLLNAMKGTVTFEALYERLDQHLIYPKEFVESGIEGSVKTVLVFSQQGDYEKHKSSVTSNSPYLSVLVKKLFREVFEDPLPKNYFHRRTTGLTVRCDFLFELHGKSQPSISRLIGNSLSFHRTSSKMYGQWRMGPLAGVGPIPAVGISTQGLEDRISGVKNMPDVEPLSKWKNDPDW